MCLRPLFTKAAQQLYIAQPSLSMALDKLGKELGVALFLGEDAHRRSARLTEAGRLLLQDARTLLDQAEVTAAHMRQFSQRDWAEVRLAYTAALAERTVPALLHDFLTGRGKGCTIYSDEMPTDRIAAGLPPACGTAGSTWGLARYCRRRMRWSRFLSPGSRFAC